MCVICVMFGTKFDSDSISMPGNHGPTQQQFNWTPIPQTIVIIFFMNEVKLISYFYLVVGESTHFRIWNNLSFGCSINLIFCAWIEQILNKHFVKFNHQLISSHVTKLHKQIRKTKKPEQERIHENQRDSSTQFAALDAN